ncbi:hypothetical protein [Thermogemmatispora sp.]|uniref:hypothetical protein n=1 Tax=Thermogemmatispora sp. TaxID=1968838 RepID=UPI0035E41AFE
MDQAACSSELLARARAVGGDRLAALVERLAQWLPEGALMEVVTCVEDVRAVWRAEILERLSAEEALQILARETRRLLATLPPDPRGEALVALVWEIEQGQLPRLSADLEVPESPPRGRKRRQWATAVASLWEGVTETTEEGSC